MILVEKAECIDHVIKIEEVTVLSRTHMIVFLELEGFFRCSGVAGAVMDVAAGRIRDPPFKVPPIEPAEALDVGVAPD
jgi:hypothetical protein